MKKLLLILLCLPLLFNSCRTINIKEGMMLKNSEYDYEKYSKYIIESTLNDKEKLTNITHNVINTENENVYSDTTINLKRKFKSINDSISMEYFVFEPNRIKQIGIFYLCAGCNVLNFIEHLSKLSSETNSKIYVLHYRDYGKSEGNISFDTQFNDNQFFINDIIQSEDSINFIVGYSLGTVFATYSAVDNKIDELYLLATFSNVEQMLKQAIRSFTKGIRIIYRPFLKIQIAESLLRISNLNKIKNYEGNLTIIHGNKDMQTPYKGAVSMYEECLSKNKKLFTIKNGGHEMSAEHWNKLNDLLK